MKKSISLAAAIVLMCVCLAGAKEKKKSTLPAYVLEAQTVLVIIDPDAGISMSDPGGNKTAQDDVETALMTWGRLKPVLTKPADLLIVVRKGNGKSVQPTVTGEPTNDRPLIVQGTDNSIRIGAQQGRSPDGIQNGGPVQQKPGMGTEVGGTEDSFLVFQGTVQDTGSEAPVWRHVAKDGLKSPDVPAVKEFKKAVDEAVKQQQQQQKQKQQGQPVQTNP